MSVLAAFDGAAQSYDDAAQLQRDVAAQLIAGAVFDSPRTILDIGCGTGILTAQAHQRWPKAAITAIDAAPAMLEKARAKLPKAIFVEADAACIPLAETFDLVLSSMVLHWLAEPAAILARWRHRLAPGGTMLVALPVAGSLAEWNVLCASHGAPGRIWRFPMATIFGSAATLLRHQITYPSAREFLRSMKDTGAASPNPAAAPTPPAVLRRVLENAPKPFTTTFHIAYLAETKTGPHF